MIFLPDRFLTPTNILDHIKNQDVLFSRTFAPNAANVCIFGSFNNWSEEPMTQESYGVYSFVSDSADFGDMYKYVIYTKNQANVLNTAILTASEWNCVLSGRLI